MPCTGMLMSVLTCAGLLHQHYTVFEVVKQWWHNTQARKYTPAELPLVSLFGYGALSLHKLLWHMQPDRKPEQQLHKIHTADPAATTEYAM